MILSDPSAPALFIRPGVSFWVESRDPGRPRATLQALSEGCFDGPSCYDRSGRLWPVEEWTYDGRRRFLAGALPWLRVEVILRFGMPRETEVSEVRAMLREILEGESPFSGGLAGSPVVQERLGSARTATELIEAVAI